MGVDIDGANRMTQTSYGEYGRLCDMLEEALDNDDNKWEYDGEDPIYSLIRRQYDGAIIEADECKLLITRLSELTEDWSNANVNKKMFSELHRFANSLIWVMEDAAEANESIRLSF